MPKPHPQDHGPGVPQFLLFFEVFNESGYFTVSVQTQRTASKTRRGAFTNSVMPPVNLIVAVPGEGFLSDDSVEAVKVYVHDAPQSLLAVFPVPKETIHKLMCELFVKYRHTILEDFPSKCISCKTLQASQLNLPAYGAFSDPNDLSINAVCVPYCHRASCEMRAMQLTQALTSHCAERAQKRHCIQVDSIDQCCHQCGKVQDQQKLVCARCNVTFYCNKACQRKHWPHHKPACKTSQRENELVTYVEGLQTQGCSKDRGHQS